MSGWCYFYCLFVFENNLDFDKMIQVIFLNLLIAERNNQVKEPRKTVFLQRALQLFCMGILASHKRLDCTTDFKQHETVFCTVP